MAVETLCFKITGDYLTEQARTFVLEDEWRKGLEMLESAFEADMTQEDMLAILRGVKKLVGVNSMDLVDEDPAATDEYRKRVDWLYADVVRSKRPNGRLVFMRPYAYVDNWGPADVYHDRTKNIYEQAGYEHNSLGILTISPESRCVRYMNDRVNDRAVTVNVGLEEVGEVIGLWEEVGLDPPPWIKIKRMDHPQRALVKGARSTAWSRSLRSAIEDGRVVERRGHNWLCKREPEIEREIKERYENNSPLQQFQKPKKEGEALVDPKTTFELCRRAGMDAAQAAKMAEGMAPLPETAPEPTEHLGSDHAWITPDGRFWPCRYMQHKGLAARMLKLLHGEDVDDAEADTRAGKRDWVKITSSLIEDKPLICAHGRRVTADQVLTAKRWCEAHRLAESDFDFFERAKERSSG